MKRTLEIQLENHPEGHLHIGKGKSKPLKLSESDSVDVYVTALLRSS